MDILDASEYDFLLSKRARKLVGFVLVLGIAFVPPVKDWFVTQIEHHAQHVTRDFMKHLAPEPPAQSDRPTRDGWPVDPTR